MKQYISTIILSILLLGTLSVQGAQSSIQTKRKTTQIQNAPIPQAKRQQPVAINKQTSLKTNALAESKPNETTLIQRNHQATQTENLSSPTIQAAIQQLQENEAIKQHYLLEAEKIELLATANADEAEIMKKNRAIFESYLKNYTTLFQKPLEEEYLLYPKLASLLTNLAFKLTVAGTKKLYIDATQIPTKTRAAIKAAKEKTMQTVTETWQTVQETPKRIQEKTVQRWETVKNTPDVLKEQTKSAFWWSLQRLGAGLKNLGDKVTQFAQPKPE